MSDNISKEEYDALINPTAFIFLAKDEHGVVVQGYVPTDKNRQGLHPWWERMRSQGLKIEIHPRQRETPTADGYVQTTFTEV